MSEISCIHDRPGLYKGKTIDCWCDYQRKKPVSIFDKTKQCPLKKKEK